MGLAVGHEIGRLSAHQIGVIALDARGDEAADDFAEGDALLVGGPGAFFHDGDVHGSVLLGGDGLEIVAAHDLLQRVLKRRALGRFQMAEELGIVAVGQFCQLRHQLTACTRQ